MTSLNLEFVLCFNVFTDSESDEDYSEPAESDEEEFTVKKVSKTKKKEKVTKKDKRKQIPASKNQKQPSKPSGCNPQASGEFLRHKQSYSSSLLTLLFYIKITSSHRSFLLSKNSSSSQICSHETPFIYGSFCFKACSLSEPSRGQSTQVDPSRWGKNSTSASVSNQKCSKLTLFCLSAQIGKSPPLAQSPAGKSPGPSPGLRLGLSRLVRVKPLHPSVTSH